MAKSSSDRTLPPEAIGELMAGQAVPQQGEPNWRYRMLLLAIGSSTPDGSDVTPSDRDLLLRMEQHLLRRAIEEGEDSAHTALMALVEILQGDPGAPASQLH